jgi:hypothetical protein
MLRQVVTDRHVSGAFFLTLDCRDECGLCGKERLQNGFVMNDRDAAKEQPLPAADQDVRSPGSRQVPPVAEPSGGTVEGVNESRQLSVRVFSETVCRSAPARKRDGQNTKARTL